MVNLAGCEEFSFAHVKFAIRFGCANRDFSQALAYISLVFNEEVSAGDIHLKDLA